ncbi:MAG: transposase [Chloroflexi bacterium]|nr:transposase [Chloroflexota bacterium]
MKSRTRTVILFMDAISIREIPPSRIAWTPIGQPACVPIIGSHDKRVLSGVLNIVTGTWLPYVSLTFNQGHFQELLCQVRAFWRGWHIVLFVDKASAHKAPRSQALAAALAIELRWLPTACPELNVMDCLWRHVRDDVLANEPTPTLDLTVRTAIDHLDALSPSERLVQAGVFADHFWLINVRNALLSE